MRFRLSFQVYNEKTEDWDKIMTLTRIIPGHDIAEFVRKPNHAAQAHAAHSGDPYSFNQVTQQQERRGRWITGLSLELTEAITLALDSPEDRG